MQGVEGKEESKEVDDEDANGNELWTLQVRNRTRTVLGTSHESAVVRLGNDFSWISRANLKTTNLKRLTRGARRLCRSPVLSARFCRSPCLLLLCRFFPVRLPLRTHLDTVPASRSLSVFARC